MKKLLTILFSISIIVGLAACSNDDTAEDTNSEDNETPEVEEQEEQATDVESDEIMDEDTEEQNPEMDDYEEASKIEEKVDLDGLEVEVETDNDNNRVLLFLDEGKEVYKTIYIKRDHRLKIIDIIDNEGQIYNDTIK